jgi:outer membrane immunogenic protein
MPNWSAKVEYLHYGFGSETFFGALSSGNLDVNTIKAGINYRF